MIEINRQWIESTIAKSHSLNTALIDYVEKPSDENLIKFAAKAIDLKFEFELLKEVGYDFNPKQSL